jgi:pimeloyl-ACP methyl ester carboxylesterase
MSHVYANTVELYYEASGHGDPLVLVHGGWSDHDNWQLVAPALAESFQVVAYDRRGHGQSERVHQGTRRDQEDDLASLIEVLDRGPAHVVGTSFGGSIAIGLAARRPDLLRSVIAHEPPLMSVVTGDRDVQPLLEQVQVAVQSVLARLAQGHVEEGARQFVEEVALGPGAWEQLPEPIRETMIDSAPAFAAEQQDPTWASVDPTALARIEVPVLVSKGTQSPPWFFGIVAKLAESIDGAELHTYQGAGHAPHITQPDGYLAGVTDFLARSRERTLVP